MQMAKIGCFQFVLPQATFQSEAKCETIDLKMIFIHN